MNFSASLKAKQVVLQVLCSTPHRYVRLLCTPQTYVSLMLAKCLYQAKPNDFYILKVAFYHMKGLNNRLSLVPGHCTAWAKHNITGHFASIEDL